MPTAKAREQMAADDAANQIKLAIESTRTAKEAQYRKEAAVESSGAKDMYGLLGACVSIIISSSLLATFLQSLITIS